MRDAVNGVFALSSSGTHECFIFWLQVSQSRYGVLPVCVICRKKPFLDDVILILTKLQLVRFARVDPERMTCFAGGGSRCLTWAQLISPATTL
jgi:hypothetical protein